MAINDGGASGPMAKRTALAAGLAVALLFTFPSLAAAQACEGPLTGPLLRLGPDIKAFGRVQGLPPLPLDKGQYVVTIDDGPNPKTTPQLLQILREHCVKATFFLVGRNAEAYPELVDDILAESHTIGTHTYTHPDLSKLTPDEIHDDMTKGIRAVTRAAADAPNGPPPLRLFRFPGSSNSPTITPKPLLAMANGDGLVVAGIDFSPQDWRNSPPEESFKRLFAQFGDRGVILFHDGMPNTLGLLPMVLDELERRKADVRLLKMD